MQKEIVDPNYSFDVAKTQNGYLVSYKKAKPSLGLLFSLYLVGLYVSIGILILTVFILPNVKYALTVTGSIFIAGPLYIFFSMRDRRSKPGSFLITSSSFVLGSKEYLFNHIKFLEIKNDKIENYSFQQSHSSNYTFFGSAPEVLIASQLKSTSDDFKNAKAKAYNLLDTHLIEINYKICFRYGDIDYILADCLTKKTAESLYEKTLELVSSQTV